MNTDSAEKAAVNAPHSKRSAKCNTFGSRVSVWIAVASAPLLETIISE
jgi:hypothetical protein